VSAGRVRFLAVGDLMIDVVVAGQGHDAVARLGPGGTAANAAVWAASLGAESAAVGAVGDDAGARFLRAELERLTARAELLPVANELGLKPADTRQVVLVPAVYLEEGDLGERDGSRPSHLAFAERIARLIVPDARARTR